MNKFQFYLVLLILFATQIIRKIYLISILLSSINTLIIATNEENRYRFQFYLVLLIPRHSKSTFPIIINTLQHTKRYDL